MFDAVTLSTRDASFWVAVGPDIAAIIATCLVLGFAVIVYLNPNARTALRRQSLQMLLSVQVATLLFSSMHIVTFCATRSKPWCEISVLAIFFTSNFQHLVIMLIAVNLQLTVVHGISTAGFTKWYVGISFLVAFVTCVPGAVRHVWGFDPFVGVCWTVLNSRRERIAWVVGTSYTWTILSTTISLFSTGAVIVRLWISTWRVRKAFSGAGLSSTGVAKQNVLRAVIVRILPHPVFLVISNIIVVTTDLLITLHRNPEHVGEREYTQTNHLDVLFGIFYTTPPLFFAFTVLFFDPSFSTAIRHVFTRRTPPWINIDHSSSSGPSPAVSTTALTSNGRPDNSTTIRFAYPLDDLNPLSPVRTIDHKAVESYPRFASWLSTTHSVTTRTVTNALDLEIL